MDELGTVLTDMVVGDELDALLLVG